MPTLTQIPLSLIFLVITAAVAVATAGYVVVAERSRRKVVDRLGGNLALDAERMASRLLLNPDAAPSARLAAWLSERMPADLFSGDRSAVTLVHAGFDGPAAPVIFTAVRLIAIVLFPLLAVVFGPKDDAVYFICFIVIGAVAGLMGPMAALDRMALARTNKIRRAVPDALDLLVVCVEAGVSLDAAMIRTSRDIYTSHPIMAEELAQVIRRVNAGMSREQALQSLHRRTGVEELRALVASMIQCERLGTSIARVLRVNAQTLRLKRRQQAEKKAAQAALKMVIPLAFLILPALMLVVLGPAALGLMQEFQ